MRPPAIDPPGKWLAFAAGYVVFCGLYLLTGRIHPLTVSPSPALFIDRLIPFVPPTVWIYYTQFFFLPASVWTLKTTNNAGRTLYSMALASAVSFCVFVLYPTTLPRPLIHSGDLTAVAFRLLYSIDSDSNCVPSLHVALACLGARGMMEENTRAGAFGVVWAGLISISTMTTKQHYLVDVISGACVAVVCFSLVKRWFVKAQ